MLCLLTGSILVLFQVLFRVLCVMIPPSVMVSTLYDYDDLWPTGSSLITNPDTYNELIILVSESSYTNWQSCITLLFYLVTPYCKLCTLQLTLPMSWESIAMETHYVPTLLFGFKRALFQSLMGQQFVKVTDVMPYVIPTVVVMPHKANVFIKCSAYYSLSRLSKAV